MTVDVGNDQLILQTSISGNGILAKEVLEEVISHGVQEFCICAGSRNAPLVYPLINCPDLKIYQWSEERSAAFFALGRIKATNKPVAVVTTSGTAVGELLPAVMEAHYSGLPLVLITADRPRRFRGSGAPQSAEQVGIFRSYIRQEFDLAEGEICDLFSWSRQEPLHLNVCFEEPKEKECQAVQVENYFGRKELFSFPEDEPDHSYPHFLQQCRFPLVVVGSLHHSLSEAAVQFLVHLDAPVYAEGISGVREDSRLNHLRITSIERLWEVSERNDYPIDGILRFGGIPTGRFWRDLEFKENSVSVCSISDIPFSGLSHSFINPVSLPLFFRWAQTIKKPKKYPYAKWKVADEQSYQSLLELFEEEPLAEASLIHQLSKQIPMRSKVYLGNSLPIREWDQAATYESRHYQMGCNRGVNGIDGQMATFLGFCEQRKENWSILGDLTVLYDLVAPWISQQLNEIHANVVIVNNGGGRLFSRMYAHPCFQNQHQLNFEPLAKLWNWRYEKWEAIPNSISSSDGFRFIELLPDFESTKRFWQKLNLMSNKPV